MDKTPQTQDSSHSPPTGDTLLQLWLESKGLQPETLEECAVRWDGHTSRLYFDYEQRDGHVPTRYIDLAAWHQGTNDKWWVPGSQARGALWHAYRHLPYIGYTYQVLVCEGETDALAAVQAKAPFDWIFAVPGANTITPELADRLNLPWLKVTLAFDNDDAGRTARDKFAWWVAERYPLHQLRFPAGTNDLREALSQDPEYSYPANVVEQRPRIAPAPPPPKHYPLSAHPLEDDKPDLNRVWDRISPKTRSTRKDARGRKIRQAFCPIHDDGNKPGAWVGEERWGCFVCGIESADVYELVGWVRGYAAPGQPLMGEAFLQAREEARRLD